MNITPTELLSLVKQRSDNSLIIAVYCYKIKIKRAKERGMNFVFASSAFTQEIISTLVLMVKQTLNFYLINDLFFILTDLSFFSKDICTLLFGFGKDLKEYLNLALNRQPAVAENILSTIINFGVDTEENAETAVQIVRPNLLRLVKLLSVSGFKASFYTNIFKILIFFLSNQQINEVIDTVQS